jgi:hypothetical protein
MKFSKYLAIAVSIAAILAVTGWILRDTLIQRISNPLLQKYNLVVTDVSLDALAVVDSRATFLDATIGRLTLEHSNGTVIEIEGLTVPVGTTGQPLQTYSAEHVSIVTASADDTAPFELAHWLDQFLALTDVAAGTEIQIAEFQLEPYPVVRDLRWTLTGTHQEISASVEAADIYYSSNRLSPDTYTFAFGASSGNVLQGEFIQTAAGIAASGASVLNVAAWERLLKLAGIIPVTIEMTSGTVNVKFESLIPYDAAQPFSVTTIATPTSTLQLAFRDPAGDTTAKLAENSAPLVINAEFPGVSWAIGQTEAEWLVTYGDWIDIPVSVTAFACRTGPVCAINASTRISDTQWPFGNAANLELESTSQVHFSDAGIRFEIDAGSSMAISKLDAEVIVADRLETTLASTATLEFAEDGWQFIADSVDASVGNMKLAENVTISMPVFLEKLVVGELRDGASAQAGIYVPAIQVKTNEQVATAPGLKGDLRLQSTDLAAELSTVGLQQEGNIVVQHNIDTGLGQLSLQGATLSFARATLSSRFLPWNWAWDLATGAISADLQASWNVSGEVASVDGHASVSLSDLGGYYSDIVMTGLSTRLEVDYDSIQGITVDAATIAIGMVDIGLVLENVSAAVKLDTDDLSASVEGLKMNAFGGVIRADPFSYRTGKESNNLTLFAESIELAELLDIKEFAAVEVTGSISAELPLTIEADGVTVNDGTLTGEPPGGVIRYHAADSEADASALGIVTTALSNFEYASLTSDVSYSKDGDLKLQMQLKGRNPEMPDSRPVVLNLGVENNVPQMLRSLQAARSVEDILRKRLAN